MSQTCQLTARPVRFITPKQEIAKEKLHQIANADGTIKEKEEFFIKSLNKPFNYKYYATNIKTNR